MDPTGTIRFRLGVTGSQGRTWGRKGVARRGRRDFGPKSWMMWAAIRPVFARKFGCCTIARPGSAAPEDYPRTADRGGFKFQAPSHLRSVSRDKLRCLVRKSLTACLPFRTERRYAQVGRFTGFRGARSQRNPSRNTGGLHGRFSMLVR